MMTGTTSPKKKGKPKGQANSVLGRVWHHVEGKDVMFEMRPGEGIFMRVKNARKTHTKRLTFPEVWDAANGQKKLL